MKILDGKKIAEEILGNLKKEIEKKQLKLKLAVVLVGGDSSSEIFIRAKKKACEFVGVDFELFKLPSKISGLKLKKTIKEIARNPEVSGMIIQLPLPKQFKPQEFLNLIPEEKNAEKISPVVCAVERILKDYGISLKGKKVVLMGYGRLVGRPVAKWLRNKKVKFSKIDKIKEADIVISGVGKPGLIKGDMVKKGVVIIDFGGDVDFESVSKKASYITPIPGGAGPVVVACLLQNLVKLAENCSPQLRRTVLR